MEDEILLEVFKWRAQKALTLFCEATGCEDPLEASKPLDRIDYAKLHECRAICERELQEPALPGPLRALLNWCLGYVCEGKRRVRHYDRALAEVQGGVEYDPENYGPLFGRIWEGLVEIADYPSDDDESEGSDGEWEDEDEDADGDDENEDEYDDEDGYEHEDDEDEDEYEDDDETIQWNPTSRGTSPDTIIRSEGVTSSQDAAGQLLDLDYITAELETLFPNDSFFIGDSGLPQAEGSGDGTEEVLKMPRSE